jgi:hypothetical protein
MTAFTRKIFAVLLVIGAGITVTADQQRSPLGRVMREKLQHAQAILGAVTTSDWATLDRESRALALVSRDPAWVTALTDPAYLKQSDAFADAVQKLMMASSKRDLEAAGAADVVLTQSCVGCHLQMSRKRIAR